MNKKKLSVIGSGCYNFDTIVLRDYPKGFVVGKNNKFTETVLFEEVGGTCGNVMCMLSYLGAHVMPQAQFDESEQGLQMKADLERYGCDTRYVENTSKGGTALLCCTHKLDKDTGEAAMSFRLTSPGSRFCRRKQLRAKDEVPQFVSSLTEAPDLYFFDQAEAGPRALAAALRERGAVVYFEPEKEDNLKKAVGVSDIVKFSGEKITDISFCGEYKDKLFIQTLGSEGLQFSLRGGEWIKVAPVPVENVVDWEGCGDTTTSVFIMKMYDKGMLSIADMTEEGVKAALEAAAEKAALCTQFMSSKGWTKND